MANKRIKDLPVVTTWSDTDVIAIDNGSTRSIEKQDLGFANDDMSNVTQQDVADLGIAKDDFSNVDLALRIPEATETVRGTVSRATTTEGATGTDTTKYISPKVLNDVLTATGVSGGILPRNFISGLVPSYISSSILEISVGSCRDRSNTLNMTLSSAFRKTLAQNWTVGQGNLGLARNRNITGFFATTGTAVTGTGTLFESEVKVGDVIYSSSNTESRRVTQTDFSMTGTITSTLTNVVGVGTLFTTETAIGEYLLVNGEARKIQNIINNTSLVLETAFSTDVSGVSFERKSDTEIVIDSAFTVDVVNDKMTLGGKYINTTYHLFLLTDGLGNIDAGYDFDINATNLLADSEIIANGFTNYRRLGSIKTDGSENIREFTSYEMDGGGIDILYNSIITETTNLPVNTSLFLEVPIGFNLRPRLAYRITVVAGTSGDSFCSLNGVLIGNQHTSSPDNSNGSSFENVYTSDGTVFYTRTGATNIQLSIYNQGYIDSRI